MALSFASPVARDRGARGAGVTAVLGPTNTGKTHLAIERMLAHSSGMIGLPLRLLAREVYNKVAQRAGSDAVALVTGEEKIKPPNPRFWVCTVEAMPRDIDVAFLAVDEVQLGADLERGHVFTDRMLNRRGREETLVLGAATVRPMVERLLPGANVVSRPRLSQLTFAGERKLTRQPRRTAIVAFSAEEVYAIAELIRRQRGGAAVVLGALSPRTRNAQVALYQSGDVDYLVATDAIGMGLNLDVDHVAFASDRKFDGYQFRRLNPAEFAQIAGRAGRATRDGTFGTTGRCAAFEQDLVQALESHAFEPVKVLQWRNSSLDFSSLGALAASLAALPSEQGLTRAPLAEDILVLEHASREDHVRDMATTAVAVERLWDVCQVPDYRKISPAAHAELIVTLYGFLMREGRIATDWFARQVAQADHAEGGIDALSTRIAHIRTWTFAANRPDWLTDPDHWQGVTRAVEDKLSDALHERLTERFVDRRTSVLMRRLRENAMLETEIGKTGEVNVEGHVIGRLEGFRFAPDPTAGGPEAKALSAAAQKVLSGEIEIRATRLAHAPDSQFVLASDGAIRWIGEAVAKLVAGDNVLRPRVRILADEHLTGAAQEMVQTRLDLWLRSHIERLLAPLFTLSAADDITGIARGVAYQLVEALGVLERSKVADEVKGLDQVARASLRKHGVRFGAYHLYIPLLLKPGPRSLAAQLWALKHGGPETRGLDDLQRLAASGRTSFAVDKDTSRSLYRTIGYRVCGERAVRVDILERLADLIRPALAWREAAPGTKPAGALDGTGFVVTPAMTSLTGASGEDFSSLLRALGYRMERRPKPAEPPAPTAEVAAAEAGQEIEVEVAAPLPGQNEAEAANVVTSELLPEVLPFAIPAVTKSALTQGQADGGREMLSAPSTVESVDSSAYSAAPPDAAPLQVTPLETEAVASAGIAHEHAASNGASAPETAEIVEAAASATETEEFIEVWRPGRSEERRRPRRHRHSQSRRGDGRGAQPDAPSNASDGASPQSAATVVAAADDQAVDGEAKGRPRRPRHRGHGRPERQDGQPAFAKRHKGASERREREKAPDPNSPFAKLAALKAQLEANAKERT